MFYITQNRKMCYSYKNKKTQKEKITEKKTINTTKQITSICTKNDY